MQAIISSLRRNALTLVWPKRKVHAHTGVFGRFQRGLEDLIECWSPKSVFAQSAPTGGPARDPP